MKFSAEIKSRQDWSRIFQSIDLFTPLAQEIFRRNALPLAPLSNLTPGTNSVFRSGDQVIKIFAPVESDFNGPADYLAERSAMEYAHDQKLPVPAILCAGEIRDRYDFCYLVMDYIDGKNAEDFLPSLSVAQKSGFIKEIKNQIQAFSQGVCPLPSLDLAKAVHSLRLEGLPSRLIQELGVRALDAVRAPFVPVHGDLTGENVLFSRQDGWVIIDWADSRMAPASYELPPLLFELFGADPLLVSAYFGQIPEDQALEQLLDGLSIHPFCGNILKDWMKRTGIPYAQIDSIKMLTGVLRRQLFAK